MELNKIEKEYIEYVLKPILRHKFTMNDHINFVIECKMQYENISYDDAKNICKGKSSEEIIKLSNIYRNDIAINFNIYKNYGNN